MKNLTEQVLAVLIVIYKVGNGTPTFMFEGFDTIDAISEGYIEELDGKYWVTKKGEFTLKEYLVDAATPNKTDKRMQ